MDHDPSPVSTESSNSDSVAFVLTACVISALLIFLVYSENFIFGSKSGNWVYPYFKTAIPIPPWTLWIVLLSLGLSIFIGSKLIHSYEKIVLAACFLNIVFIQFLIRQVYPYSLGSIVQSDGANSFYS